MGARGGRVSAQSETEGRLSGEALRQDARHFAGLSTGEAERLRGRILAAYERGGVPEDAVPAIREELRTSLSPIVVAGAARAVRSLDSIDEEMLELLAGASERIGLRDEYVAFDSSEPLTAREEIAATLALRPGRPCCGAKAAGEAPPFEIGAGALDRVVVQDQSQARSALVPLLGERTSLIAFFYTRCMNPAKCSLTITRLAALARRPGPMAAINLVGFSYDGRFDTPERLLTYGLNRGFEFGDRARLLRCVSGWADVRSAFRLRVGYGPSTVNDHAREIFLVRPDLRARGLDPGLLAEPDRLERLLGG